MSRPRIFFEKSTVHERSYRAFIRFTGGGGSYHMMKSDLKNFRFDMQGRFHPEAYHITEYDPINIVKPKKINDDNKVTAFDVMFYSPDTEAQFLLWVNDGLEYHVTF